jgi:hypothetical protein
MYDLAVVLHKTMDEIEAMSSRALSEWMAFARIHPLPNAHWDAAMLASHVNRLGGGKAKIEDLMPQTVKVQSPSATLSPEESVKALASAFASASMLRR